MKPFPSNVHKERTSFRSKQNLRQCLVQVIRLSLIGGFLAFGTLAKAESLKKANEKPAKEKQSKEMQTKETQSNQRKPKEPPAISRAYDKPRMRVVFGTKAIVRCGPGEQYYETTTLAPKTLVEVYVETSDGWSGIRPPAGSHNWITARNAFLLPGGKVAEIIEDDTPAWVGSDAEQMKQLMWQTGLAKSQQVQILGEDHQLGEDGSKQLWYRISPPQGEFRWIRTSLLVDQNIEIPKSSRTQVDPAVQKASFEQSVGSGVVRASANVPASAASVKPSTGQSGPSEEVVWSDESQVLAKINREIEAEQAKINNEMRAQGIPASKITRPSGVIVDGQSSSLLEGGEEVVEDLEIAPTPEEIKRANRRKAAEHQIDSFQHWDSMQNSPNPKLRNRPLTSILGLIGFGIVETERPIATEMARAKHEFVPHGQSLPHLGPHGSSRLDRLPRPGRRPGMTLPLDGVYDDSYSSFESNYIPLDSNRPMIDRLWSSNQPLFNGSNHPYSNGIARGSSAGLDSRSGLANSHHSSLHAYDTDNELSGDWHGIRSRRAQSVSDAMKQAYSEPMEDVEFVTPEIQQAMLELSSVVSKPTEEWDLRRFYGQCEFWIEQGQTALIRGEARLLMERLEQFEGLRIRTLNSLQNGAMLAADSMRQSMGNLNGPTSLASSTGVSQASATNVGNGVSFASASTRASEHGDASGWLVQVHNTFPDQPDYALTDDSGNVITYVRSTAALNLRRYLQQPVMIQGVRGYIPSLAAKQIVAERVVRLR